MTEQSQSRSSDSRLSLTMKINGDAGARLQELAAEQGVPPSRLAREMLEEIVPKVESVQRRVVIKLKSGQQ